MWYQKSVICFFLMMFFDALEACSEFWGQTLSRQWKFHLLTMFRMLQPEYCSQTRSLLCVWMFSLLPILFSSYCQSTLDRFLMTLRVTQIQCMAVPVVCMFHVTLPSALMVISAEILCTHHRREELFHYICSEQGIGERLFWSWVNGFCEPLKNFLTNLVWGACKNSYERWLKEQSTAVYLYIVHSDIFPCEYRFFFSFSVLL